jgi:hypothetical protein
VIFRNVLSDGVPKVPKVCFEGFCHFWHLMILEFLRSMTTHPT